MHSHNPTSPQHHTFLVLDNIRSTYNVGAIFRTSDAAGVAKIYLCGATPTPIDRFGRVRKDIAKTALGAEQTVSWEYCEDALTCARMCKGLGTQIIAVEQDPRAIPYTNPLDQSSIETEKKKSSLSKYNKNAKNTDSVQLTGQYTDTKKESTSICQLTGKDDAIEKRGSSELQLTGVNAWSGQARAFVFGDEVRGVSPEVLDLADAIIEIPMYGKKESLNVSVAVGIILFHQISNQKYQAPNKSQ